MQIFGEASGMQTNLRKVCVIPMHCDGEIEKAVGTALQCTISNFPTTYLGLPISDKELRRSDDLAWIEKIGNKFPSWKASLMTLVGRAVLVQFVLTAIPIYLLVAIKVPQWFILVVDKIRRSFLW